MTWRREGRCQPEVCGSACCRFVVLDVNPAHEQTDTASWLSFHGIALAPISGRTLARIPLECAALSGEGRCAVYGTNDRPTLCGDFPRGPGDLIGLDGRCTYTFTEDS